MEEKTSALKVSNVTSAYESHMCVKCRDFTTHAPPTGHTLWSRVSSRGDFLNQNNNNKKVCGKDTEIK